MKFRDVILLWLLPVVLAACSKNSKEEGIETAPIKVEQPSSTEKKTVKLFVIGNSFSQNATSYLPNLAAEAGHTLTIGRAELSSYSLQMHWEGVVANLANNANGRLYKGKSLKELLAANPWDVVSIQQVSTLSGKESSYEPYLKNLIEFIRSVQPKAEILLHQTWAYRSDATGFTQTNTGSAKTEMEMWQKVRAAYQLAAKQYNLRIIPVGDAFWKVSADNTWKFKKDMSFNYSNPVHPNLPNEANSLHIGYYWDGNTFGFDSHHASMAGCYLGSLTWYYTLFRQSPAQLSFQPSAVPVNFAAFLKDCAVAAVEEKTP